MYVIFSLIAILNARFFLHVGIYNFARAVNISVRAFTSSNVHLDFQLTIQTNSQRRHFAALIKEDKITIDTTILQSFSLPSF